MRRHYLTKKRYEVKNEQGFTLLELMIAITLISIVLIGLISALMSCMTLDKLSKEYNMAATAAKQELERLQIINYNDEIANKLAAGGGQITGDFDVPGLKISPKDSYGASNKSGYYIIKEVNAGDHNLVDIKVIIEWKTVVGRYKKIEIITRRSDRGENWQPS